jgi:hypothetical protein
MEAIPTTIKNTRFVLILTAAMGLMPVRANDGPYGNIHDLATEDGIRMAEKF